MSDLRRLRRTERLRQFTQDVRLHPKDFVLPIFVKEGIVKSAPVSSMPGVFQFTVDDAVEKIRKEVERGINQFMLFGIVSKERKDEIGSASLDEQSPVAKLIKKVREEKIDALLIADLCFCEYTDHGHCGALSKDHEETIDHEKTRELLAKQAQVLASVGADIIAPSGMVDGMVKAIRLGLDDSGYVSIPIMSYTTKYASNFYGPFRDAGEGAPQFGSRKAYQMDYRRANEWRQEVEADISEGADLLLVKPAMSYLDILHQVSKNFSQPVGAYHVSGEYSMLHAAAREGLIDLEKAATEQLIALKRAGASFIVTYFADQVLDWEGEVFQ